MAACLRQDLYAVDGDEYKNYSVSAKRRLPAKYLYRAKATH